jgi:hypothetical protein
MGDPLDADRFGKGRDGRPFLTDEALAACRADVDQDARMGLAWELDKELEQTLNGMPCLIF